VDGIRLDAADVLNFDFMKQLRGLANTIKPDFWLMGEVIHGEYVRWVNEGTLHSVTNYHLHKALYSGHNDHNYFEIAHTVKRLQDMGVNRNEGCMLYNFVDNHDVERIFTKLNNKAHFVPVHFLLYTLPGIPSIYYGSEYAIEGKKEKFSDASLRPCMKAEDYKENDITALFKALSDARFSEKTGDAFTKGGYRQVVLTNRQYVFARDFDNQHVYVAVNNDENESVVKFNAGTGTLKRLIFAEGSGSVVGKVDTEEVDIVSNGGNYYELKLPACSGMILVET
jgi:glycosidase